MRCEAWMATEERPPSKSLQLARRLAALTPYRSSLSPHEVVPMQQLLSIEERDLIVTALRTYDKDI